MDRDVLERLATDRALGALTPEVEHLLDSYLQLDASAAETAGQIGQTVGLAREALAEQPPSSMPAFPVAGFLQIERWRRRVQRFTYVAGLAACLSLGLGIGRLTAPAPVGYVEASDAGQAVQLADASASGQVDEEAAGTGDLVRSDASDTGFWSVERLMQQREDQLQPGNPPAQDIRSLLRGWNLPT